MNVKEKLLKIIDSYQADGQLTDEEYEEMLAIVERGTKEKN